MIGVGVISWGDTGTPDIRHLWTFILLFAVTTPLLSIASGTRYLEVLSIYWILSNYCVNSIIATLTTITFLSSSCDFFCFQEFSFISRLKRASKTLPPPPLLLEREYSGVLQQLILWLHYYSNLSIFISYGKVPICLPAEVNLFSFVTHVKVLPIGLPTEVNQQGIALNSNLKKKKLGRDFIFEFLFCQLGTSRSIEQGCRYE